MQNIPEDFTRRSERWLHFHLCAVGQVYGLQLDVHLVSGEKVFHAIFKIDGDDGQSEHRITPDVAFLLDRTHRELNGCGHKTLYFLGTAPVPLGNDDDLRIGDIWESLNRHIFKTDKTCNRQNSHPHKGEGFILQRKGDNVFNKFIHEKKRSESEKVKGCGLVGQAAVEHQLVLRNHLITGGKSLSNESRVFRLLQYFYFLHPDIIL